MPFTKNDYPDSLKNLTTEVRYKAIDIINSLMEEKDMEEGRAIAIGTAQAEKWAENRDEKVKK
jgi:uncharacterized protein YdaT